MTPPDPPDDLDLPDIGPDELAVHAVLDGEATPDERRRVARDPRLRALLEDLRATAAAVGTAPPAPDDDALARIRARALDALDADDLGDEGTDGSVVPGPPPAPDEAAPGEDGPDQPLVVALGPRRAPRRLPPLPAVAAVVLVLLVLGVGLIATGGGGDDSADATGSGNAARAEADASSAAPEEGAAADSGGEASTTVPAGTPTYPSDDDLRLVLQRIDPVTLGGLGTEAGAPGTSPGAATDRPTVGAEGARCGDVLQASDRAIGPVQAAALTEVDGTLLVVLSTPVAATESAPASTRLTVLEAASCVPRFAVQRDP